MADKARRLLTLEGRKNVAGLNVVYNYKSATLTCLIVKIVHVTPDQVINKMDIL